MLYIPVAPVAGVLRDPWKKSVLALEQHLKVTVRVHELGVCPRAWYENQKANQGQNKQGEGCRAKYEGKYQQ